MSGRGSLRVARNGELATVALSRDDLDAVEALRVQSSGTLGFATKVTLAEYLDGDGGIGVKGTNGLVGYVLFGIHRHHVRVMHLCVAPSERGGGLARRLVEAVVQRAAERGIGVVKLNCRRDYPANSAWPKLDFYPLEEKKAKTQGKWLVTWYRFVPGAAQQDIFSTIVSDKVKAVIDAQILFQLQQGDDDVANGLQADFLADVLELYRTNEIFNEIHRAKEAHQRRQSRDYAQSFPSVEYDEGQRSTAATELERILPSSTESDKSDLQQVAITAASTASIFLTRDDRLLKKAKEIKLLTSVDVLHPRELITRLAEFTDRKSYNPAPLSGMNLVWRRIGEADMSETAIGNFLGHHEHKGGLRKRFDAVLSNPKTWRTEGLWSADIPIAVRSVKHDLGDARLIVGLCRACRGADQSVHTDYALAGLAQEAVEFRCETIELDRLSVTPEAVGQLGRFGFVEVADKFVRDCPAATMSVSTLRARVAPRHHDIPSHDLGRACSPVALEDDGLPCLMVPIKPGYARSLFDTNLAGDDLFGAEKSVLMRLENVYYRAKTHHQMITAPARILWYVSNGIGVVAMSYLDDVRIGGPKEIFREHRRLGALAWREIRELCGGDSLQEIMVLKFSHSFLFQSRIDLHTLRDIYDEHSRSLVIQSPSSVPRDIFLEIHRQGFSKGGVP